jgi:dipeptidyl-peptidase 4
MTNQLRSLAAWPLALLACAVAPAATPSAAVQVAPPVASGQLSLERIFAAPDLSGASLRNPRFSPDGRLVTFLQGRADDKDRLDLWAWDVQRRRAARLVDSTSLGAGSGASAAGGDPAPGTAPGDEPGDEPGKEPNEARNDEEQQRRERQRTSSLSGIVDYAFSPDSRRLLFPVDGDLWLFDRDAPPARAVRRLTRTAAVETDPKFSPRGRFVSFVRGGNLFVLDLASGREQPVTRGGAGTLQFGVAEFVAQEEMDRSTGYWWAPDESRIAFTRVDEAPVDEVERFEILASSVRVIRQRYPAAGRPNADVQLWIAALRRAADGALQVAPPVRASLGGGAPPQAGSGATPDGYLARVDWFPDASALAVQWQSRDQRRLVLRRIDAADGRSQDLLEERSDSWVPLHDELTFLPRRRAFLWASNRSGYRHLYLYGYDGRLRRPVTAGEWMVTGDGGERAIEAVDEARGLVYFTANRETPIERHLYSAPLDGPTGDAAIDAGLRRLTTRAGWHSVTMSPDARLWLDTFSDPGTPPSLTLHRTAGRQVDELVANRLDDTHPYAPFLAGTLPTEFGTLRAADGQVLHYQLIRPRTREPGQRHPVVVDVYGGPGFQRVRRAWAGFPRSNEGFFRQYLAQQGYVVFTLDNRGSGFRGDAFEAALHRRLGSVEVEDQVRGVAFLRTLPFVDPARIGVYGWSYGGYLA